MWQPGGKPKTKNDHLRKFDLNPDITEHAMWLE